MTGPVELIVVGTGGLAKETAQLARRIDPQAQRWSTITYAAESTVERGRALQYGSVRYVDADLLARTERADVAIGIGHPGPRRRLATQLIANTALTFPNLIHPAVTIDGTCVRLGRGNLVTEGVVITCDITIGDFNLLGWNVTVGHDARIGSFNVVNPGSNVSGYVHIGDGCLLGTGCQVLEKLAMADSVTLGAGAVLTRSVETSGTTWVGVPARARSR